MGNDMIKSISECIFISTSFKNTLALLCIKKYRQRLSLILILLNIRNLNTFVITAILKDSTNIDVKDIINNHVIELEYTKYIEKFLIDPYELNPVKEAIRSKLKSEPKIELDNWRTFCKVYEPKTGINYKMLINFLNKYGITKYKGRELEYYTHRALCHYIRSKKIIIITDV